MAGIDAAQTGLTIGITPQGKANVAESSFLVILLNIWDYSRDLTGGG
jgi:hypothetical protein